MNKRIVITGIGIVSPNYIGSDIKEFLFAIMNNNPEELRSSIKKLDELLEKHVPYSQIRRMGRFSEIALYSNILANMDAAIDITSNNERIGSIMNTLYGPLQTTEKLLNDLITGGPQNVSPSDFANTVMNSATGQVSMAMGLKGVSTTLIGSSAITYAYDLIKYNKADAIFVSGVDEFNLNVQKANNNISILESGICLLLEEYQHAKNRNAKIYSEIISCGVGFEDETGVKKVLNEVLENVDYKNKTIYGVLSSTDRKRKNEIMKETSEIIKDFKAVFECEEVFGEPLGAAELLTAVLATSFEASGTMINNFSSEYAKRELLEMSKGNILVTQCIQRGGCSSIVVQGGAPNV